MVQGAHSAPPPSARVALNVSTWKHLSPTPMWCYSKRKHTTELRTRETQRPGGQLMPSFQTPAPTAFSSKCTACHKKLCPPWSSSCQLFTAKGKMTQLPLCTDLEMLVTPTSWTRWTASLKILHAIQYPAFFKYFLLVQQKRTLWEDNKVTSEGCLHGGPTSL